VARPKLALFAPPVLFAGHEHVIEFEVTPDQPISVDYVEMRLVGTQGWELGSGKSKVSEELDYPWLDVRLMERGVLPAQPSRFSLRFTLPRDTAPTHEIDPAYARLVLQIRLGVPWWFDVKYRYVLPVRLPPPATVQRTPAAVTSLTAGAPADKPRIELALASTRLIAGEQVTGSVAVFHLDDDKPRDVTMSLFPKLTLLKHGRTRYRDGGHYNFTVTLPAGSGGTSVPFAFRVPAHLPPTFATRSHAIAWALRAHTGSFFGASVAVGMKLEIVDQAAAATTPQLAAPPRLADERVAALFHQFAAANGWESTRFAGDADAPMTSGAVSMTSGAVSMTSGAVSMTSGAVSIQRVVGESSLRIAYVYREDGTFLVGRVAAPSLGLGLSVTPSSALRHVFWKDIEVDISAWDRAHHVTARFAEQTIPALEATVPTLMRLPALGALVRWTDDEIVFEQPVPLPDKAHLISTASALEAVAATLDAARLAIAPPPTVAVELARWHELARWLETTLVVGDLSIVGRLGKLPVELGLEFDEEHRPLAVYAIAGNPDETSDEVREIKLSLPRPASDILGANVAEQLVDPLSRWPADFVELEVANGSASARWRLPPPGDAPLPLDAGRAKDLIVGLAGVLAALEPGTGPYR
jgi:hypothetical protein